MYLTRVDVPVDWRAPTDETLERPSATRTDVERVLDELTAVPGEGRQRPWTPDRERWSVWKLLPRPVGHERDHLTQLEWPVAKVEDGGD